MLAQQVLSPTQPSPQAQLWALQKKIFQFSKIAESSQCGSYVSSEGIRSWFGQRVASCCPWCFHLLWIRKRARQQLLLYFNSWATYQCLQRQAGHCASEKWSCLFSVLVPSLETRLYLGTVLKTVKTHPVSDSRKFSFGFFLYLVFGIITTCILTWWNPLSIFFLKKSKI